jgi:hypothetical protein
MNPTGAIRQRVDEILADDRLDPTAGGKTDAIEALIPEFGWETVRECMMDLLRDDAKSDQWNEAMHVFWGAVLDNRPLPMDELIAWLYYRFDPHGDDEDNEVWSITSKLKGVSYFSKYQPLRDPGVMQYLHSIRGR